MIIYVANSYPIIFTCAYKHVKYRLETFYVINKK